MPYDAEVPETERQGHRGQRDRGGRRDRRLGTGDAGRHQPAERSADPRGVRQQVGLADERARGVRQRDIPASMRRRVLVDAGGGRRAARSTRRSSAELHDRHARGDRPRVGPAGGRRHAAIRRRRSRSTSRRSRKAAPISSASTSSPTRSWPSSASFRPPIRTRSSAPSTRPTRATRSCSCAGSARGRRSRKTTCATGR